MIEIKKNFSRSRIEHAEVFGVYKLTEREKINLGLKRKPPETDLVKVVIPVHRTSSSMAWETRAVPRATAERLRRIYGGGTEK